ncbi:MAG: hypothetical protein QOE79_2329 [Sphingomonadales bacterium]|jgi:hypothetical protein|nr:hypothetical protein [Sphingomonadales bacterium]MEA3049277.1 hypothetical protein [Sphingomonadales bacterium]
MPGHVLFVDLAGLILAVAGFHLAFRQRFVRRWWGAFRSGGEAAPPRPAKRQEEDPVHYAMIISGMMILAFGLILFAFTTFYWLLTRHSL